jgi:hypothetical protein
MYGWKKVLICLFGILLTAMSNPTTAGSIDATWRSSLYPLDWTHDFTDAEGRFLHDFSYAGYHMGEKPLPDALPGPIVDVTKPPYNADNTGTEIATHAIQAALNDVGATGGGTVYLPAGTYRIKFTDADRPAALYMTYSNVLMKGDGPDKTFLYLDEKVTRRKTMIAVGSLEQPVSLTTPKDGIVAMVAADVPSRETVIPLAGDIKFSIGDWVAVQYTLTDAWIAEHNMTGGWDSSISGPAFFRRIVAVDHEKNTITVDIPLRYPIKIRDQARVYSVNTPLSEIGLEGFSIGMRQHTAIVGWGNNDHSKPGYGAYDVHAGIMVSFRGVVDSWVRDVATYKPPGNRQYHIHSIGFFFTASRNLTVQRVRVENPQYRGGGGNGYPFEINSQECLFDSVVAINGRHNLTITGQQASGNVIYRSYISNPIQSLPADFHMNLSPANLIDNLTIDQDRFEAADRSGSAGVSGYPKHGVTTTESVFWNTEGLAYREDMQAIIRSEQFGWGYVIGTRGPAYKVNVETYPRTAPADWLEGEGRGAQLLPQSLYYDQLQRRLLREGKHEQWALIKENLAPPPITQK